MLIDSIYDDEKVLSTLALSFIWLLRDDVRKGAHPSQLPTPEFERWWTLCGRAEYPAWDTMSEAEFNSLGELVTPAKIEGLSLNLPRAVKLLSKYRPDVRRQFTQDNRLDLIAFIGWFFILGLKEHALEKIVKPELIAELDRPLLSYAMERDSVDQPVPSVTVLMRLVWQLLDPQMQKSLVLTKPDSRERFLVWFFCVATRLYALPQLISNRWKNWLLQEQYAVDQSDIRVPRFALMEYKVRHELKDQFSLATKEGLEQLKVWSDEALNVGGPWHWLKSTSVGADSTDTALAPSPNLTEVWQKPFGVNLYGYAFGELGIGEDLRMAVAVCESAGIPYRVVNINAGKDLRQADTELSAQVDSATDQAPYAVNIFCLPAFDIVTRIFLAQGPNLFRKHYNIGWCPWELSVWPKAWKSAFDLLDEVWAGSSFSLAMYQKTTLKPCYLMPLAASVERLQVYGRKHFKLPVKAFLFLYVFDFNSHLNRKNPRAVIKAFVQAFPRVNRSVGLVLKIMNAKVDDPAWVSFLEECRTDNRIHIIHTTMDRPEILGLMQTCDAYVSPHRAEGFGRTLAEAMLLGKPVVATNYSGNVDYMDSELTLPVDYELVSVGEGDYHFIRSEDGALWAEPSSEHLVARLREAILLASNAEKIEKLKAYSVKRFGVPETAKLMKARMLQIKTQLASEARQTHRKKI